MRQNQQVALLAVLSFLVYGACRAHSVGDCDSWAYFAQAQLFLGRDPGLHSFVAPLRHPALTPLGMDVARGGFVSAFPPGFSLLLAFAGLVGTEYWVDPVLGAVSVVLIYTATRREAPHSMALALSALWAVCPLVAANATDVMSDMAATVAVLGCYVLARYHRHGAAGAVLGLSLMVRPMNLLFLPCALVLLSRRSRDWARFFGGLAAFGVLSASVHFYVWADLLSPSYRDNAHHFLPKYFPAQFPAYAREAALHLGLVLVTAAVQAVRAPRESIPELVWLGAFFLVYPFAGPVGIDWLRARFLLPAFPAAFVLAARGWTELGWLVQRLMPRARHWGSVLVFLPAALWGSASVARSLDLGALSIHPARDVDCDELAARLPHNALVGALEFSGALRLYAGRETFVWLHPAALDFARDEYAKGRPLYLLLEPEELEPHRANPYAARFTVAFDLAPRFKLPASGFLLNEVVGVRKPGESRLDPAHPMNQWAFLSGWVEPNTRSGANYRLVGCDHATLELLLEPGLEHEIGLAASAPEDRAPESVQVSLGGRPLGSAVLRTGVETFTVRIPADLATGPVALELRFPGAPRCDATAQRAVARVHSVEIRALGR